MKRSALVFVVAAIGFAACGGEEPAEPSAVPDRVETEQALELIRACRVTGVGGTHAGEMELSLEGGRTVTIVDPDSPRVWETTKEASRRCGEIEMYTE